MTEASRSALIVASDAYDDPGLGQLRAPAHDAEALARVLGNDRIGGFDVRTLFNEPAHAVSVAIEDFFADRRPDDLLLLHISAHGVKDEGGELHFATTNTELRRLASTSVSAEFVNRRMSRSRSRRIVLMLDCCYAGAFERGMTARAGSGVGIEEQFGGRGRAVITASSAMEYAFEGDQLADTGAASPSVFTTAVVEGLETGEADRDQDGRVALGELYDYVYARVRESTPNQTPSKWTFGLQGDLYIARRARPVKTPTPLPIELQQVLEHPLAGVRAGAVQELTRLLNGRHAGLALAARFALEQLVDDDSRTVAAEAASALATATTATDADFAAAGAAEPGAAEPGAAEPGAAEPRAEQAPAVRQELPPEASEVGDGATDPGDASVPEVGNDSEDAKPTGDPPDAHRRVTAGLAIAATVALVMSLVPPFQWGEPLYYAPMGMYAFLVALATLAAWRLLARAVRPFTGPGFLVGLAVASVWGLLQLAALLEEDGLGPGYVILLLAVLLLLAAAVRAGSGVARTGEVRFRRELAANWLSRLTILLGGVGAMVLLALVGELDYQGAPGLAIGATAWMGIMALAVPVVATMLVPIPLGRSLVAGWIAGALPAAAMYLVWDNTEEWHVIQEVGAVYAGTFAGSLLLLLVPGVVLRRGIAPPSG